MKMVLVIYSGSDQSLVPSLLDEHRAGGYSEFRNVHGAGETGRREGTRAWPGEASVYFSIVPAERAGELIDALRDAAGELPADDRLHVAVLPTETFF